MAVISRNHLRDNDQVWILKDDNTLEIRDVTILARTHDKVLISSGLNNREKLIVSNLANPVEGIKLKNGNTIQKSNKVQRSEEGK